MPEELDRKRMELSFRKFNDFANDALSSNYHLFNTRFNIFINHCENDPVMSIICNQLKSIDIEFDKWWTKCMRAGGSTLRKGVFDLPVDETKRDALLYQICLKVNRDEINYFDFSMKFFGSSSKSVAINAFNEAIVKPLVRSINYKLEEIMYDIENDLRGERYIPIKVLNVYLNSSTIVNGDVNIKGDSVIGEGASIEKKSIF